MIPANVTLVRTNLESIATDPNTPAPVRDWAAFQMRLLDFPPELEKGAEMPATLGGQVDEYSEVREERLKLEKLAARVKERETELFNAMLSTLNESADTGASGEHHRVQRVEKVANSVADWDAVHAFILANNAWEIMAKSVNQKALNEYVEEQGAPPPGIERKTIATLSITKI